MIPVGVKSCVSLTQYLTLLCYFQYQWSNGAEQLARKCKNRDVSSGAPCTRWAFFGDQSCVGDVLWLPWNLACNRNFSRVKNARIGEFQNAALGKIKHFELGIKILCRPLASTSTVGTSKTLYGCRDLLRNLKDDKGSRRTAMVA